MAPVRRAPAAAPVAAPPPPGVNFGDLDFYSGSFILPKGRYALDFQVLMHNPTRQDGTPVGKPRLGVMVNAYPLDTPGADPLEQFFSMGSKADLSFAPDATTGKSLVQVPGGPAATAQRNTNWNLLLKSLYDCGLPKGIFTNDVSVIDGIWVQTDLVPEPEERKGYAKAATGEAQEEERKGSGLIPVVVEIIEGGKPWEGGGGFPDAAQAAQPAAPVPSKPAAARPAAARTAAPAPTPVAVAGSEDAETAVINGISSVLEAEPNGTSKLKVRTGTFKYLNANGQAAVAQDAIHTYFATDDALNSILAPLGYVVKGQQIVPA